MLHNILFFQRVLLVDHVIQGKGENHGNHLQILLSSLQGLEELFEVIHSTGKQSNLIF